MKRRFIRAAAAMLSGILMFTGVFAQARAIGAPAATANVELNGVNARPQWEPLVAKTYGPAGNEIKDLFGEVTKGLAPGDEKTVSVRLRNGSADTVVFYLKARALDAERANELAGEAYFDKSATTAALNAELLSQIRVTVTHLGATLYAGTLGGASADDTMYTADYGAALGAVSAGWYGDIVVTLTVGDLDNRFQNLLTGVEWVFVADQRAPEVVNPGTPDPTPPPATQPPASGDPDAPPAPPVEPADPNPDPGETDIAEAEPPLAGLDDAPITDIGEDDVPLDAIPDIVVVPKTGDDGGVMTYATVAGIALVIMAVLLVTSPRKRKQD
jgi:hypothetical protein